ncbi:hypothetical protein BDV93DRAFT_582024 [Ceratobasidium sp. AG-I]|nr:hypothetical protein BDV93DRAFT_582024 [Ceratobasidium sp. AG-I]
MEDYMAYTPYINDPTTPIASGSPTSPTSSFLTNFPMGFTSPLALPRLDTTQITYLSGPISAAPNNDHNPDAEPASLGTPNSIVFPMYRRNDSTNSKESKTSMFSRMPLITLKPLTSPQVSYRPHQLSKSMLKSRNSSDHLRRIHITSSQYCRQQTNGQEFILFSVLDSALPKISNWLILDRNGRRVVKNDSSNESQHIAQCWSFNLQSLLERMQPPGRFYISNVKDEQEFVEQIGLSSYKVEHELTLTSDPAFSLDHLLVLASGLATPLRFRYPSATQVSDWYPKSMWEAMQLVSEFIQNEEPLPMPLQLRDHSMDAALLEKVLAKYANNLRKYRSKVMRHQQREDSDPAVQEKRHRETEAEVERHTREIENQKKESLRLEQEREILAREQDEMRAEIARLRREAGDAEILVS